MAARIRRPGRRGIARGNARAKRTTGGSVRRALGLLAFMPLASRLPMYARLVWALVLDDRTPAPRKAILGGAVGYLLFGRDLVPDDVPLVGGLDDLVVVALAVDLFLDGVPSELLAEKLDELGIERGAFERDVAQLRRLMPGPIRRTIKRIPAAVAFVGRAASQSGLAPRLRRWIESREGSPA
jgi:uncharacterized membrane protein YkvA (DUF1232 family)